VWEIFAKSGLLSCGGIDRLIELQAELTDYGNEADEGIASYIESCRAYRRLFTAFQESINVVTSTEAHAFLALTEGV